MIQFDYIIFFRLVETTNQFRYVMISFSLKTAQSLISKPCGDMQSLKNNHNINFHKTSVSQEKIRFLYWSISVSHIFHLYHHLEKNHVAANRGPFKPFTTEAENEGIKVDVPFINVAISKARWRDTWDPSGQMTSRPSSHEFGRAPKRVAVRKGNPWKSQENLGCVF